MHDLCQVSLDAMQLRAFVILPCAVFLALLCLSYVQAQSTRSKEDLTNECYHNWTVRDRFRRLPMTMDNLIGLIKKVEQHPTAYNWDVQTMAANLLKRFKIDGMQFLPLSIGGRLQMDAMEKRKQELLWKITNIGRAEDFPEDSLTVEEKCSLHWMLSYSLNDTRRSEEGGGFNYPPPSNNNNNNNNNNNMAGQIPSRPRVRREALERSERQASGRQGILDYEKSLHPLEKGVVYSEYGTVAAGQVLMGLAFGSAAMQIRLADLFRDKPDVVTFIGRDSMLSSAVITNYYAATVAGDLAQSAVYGTTSSLSGSQGLIGPSGTWTSYTQMGGYQPMTGTSNSMIYPTEYPLTYERERVSYATNAEVYGGIDGKRLGRSSSSRFFPFCPRTGQIGTVEALQSCNKFAKNILSLGLLLARKVMDWKSSAIKLSHILEMYYSDRGVSLAGELNRVFGACNRFELVKDESLVPSTDMDLQPYQDELHRGNFVDFNPEDRFHFQPILLHSAQLFYFHFQFGAFLRLLPGLLLEVVIGWDAHIYEEGGLLLLVDREVRAMAYALTLDEYGTHSPFPGPFTSSIDSQVQSVLQQYQSILGGGGYTCKNLDQHLPAPNVDLYVIFDLEGNEYDVQEAKEVVVDLVNRLDLDPAGTCRVALNFSSNTQGNWTALVDMGQEFNQGSFAFKLLKTDFRFFSSDFDLGEAMNQLRRQFNQERKYERDKNIAGTNTKVVLFVVPSNRPESRFLTAEELERRVQDFANDLPDVRVIFATKASEWDRFVKKPTYRVVRLSNGAGETLYRDVISITPSRLLHPKCLQESSDENNNKYEGRLVPKTTKYMMYDDYWFDRSGDLILKVKSDDSSVNLEVCWGRYQRNSDQLQPRSDECKTTAEFQGREVVIDLNDPCGDDNNCDPIFLSVKVPFTIRHHGMRCGAATFGLSALLLLLCLLVARQ
ncbi:unnamed protein product [Darwinula stevensoni]|uniref:VWFA domain-containing protein n=1 Tax=Darwinula stevensoni TaxID=69355 RepID=A0A7R8XIL6_9CRUS|nr:unnamed protein product [Darwinula stevensoni]CAG0893968.1 unnamed protein product [Darwinula stevensoni]